MSKIKLNLGKKSNLLQFIVSNNFCLIIKKIQQLYTSNRIEKISFILKKASMIKLNQLVNLNRFLSIKFITKILYPSSQLNIQNEKSSKQQIPSRLQFIEQNQTNIKYILNLNGSKQSLRQDYDKQLKQLSQNKQINQAKFKAAQQSNQNLYSYIQKQILVQNQKAFDETSNFIKYAHYYFLKQGKKVRPLMIKLLQNSILSRKHNLSNEQVKLINQKNKKWAALIEILHIASLAHDDIIDQSPSRRGQVSQHLKYGKRMAVFSGNYIISKASRQNHSYNSPKLFQIYSIAMDNLATGQIIQALTKNRLSTNQNALQSIFGTYMNKTYYKTAALMANALRAVPLICDPNNPQFQIQSFRAGQHFGIAFQIVDDILDYISTQQEMGKQQIADIRQGNVTAPVYLTLYQEKQTKQISQVIKDLKRKNKTKQQALQIKKWVHQGKGIELSYLLALKHIDNGMNYLQKIGLTEQEKGPWKYLALKLLTRRK